MALSLAREKLKWGLYGVQAAQAHPRCLLCGRGLVAGQQRTQGTLQSQGLLFAVPGLLVGFLLLLLHSRWGMAWGHRLCAGPRQPTCGLSEIRPWALHARLPGVSPTSLGCLPCGRGVLLAGDPVWTLAQMAPSQGLSHAFEESLPLGGAPSQGFPHQHCPSNSGFSEKLSSDLIPQHSCSFFIVNVPCSNKSQHAFCLLGGFIHPRTVSGCRRDAGSP